MAESIDDVVNPFLPRTRLLVLGENKLRLLRCNETPPKNFVPLKEDVVLNGCIYMHRNGDEHELLMSDQPEIEGMTRFYPQGGVQYYLRSG